MKRVLLLSLVLFSLLWLTACNKNNENPVEKTAIDELVIPDGFTFESTIEKDVSITMPSSIDFTAIRSRVDVYSDLPANGGQLLSSSAVMENGKCEIHVKIPAALQQLYVETAAGSTLLSLAEPSLKEGGIVIDFNEPISFIPPEPIEELKSNQILNDQFIGKQLKSTSSVVNLVQNGDFSINSFGNMVDWPSPMTVDGKWYITSTLGPSYAKQYTQSGEKMMRVTPSSARYGGVAQLVAARPGDLITFTADLRSNGNASNISWLFLIPRDAAGNSISYYSIQTNNTSNAWVTRTIIASMPAGTVSVQVLLWSHIYGGAIDYDHVIVTGPVADTDGDGVDNELDEYPDDAERAFNVFYPNESDFGSLAFEDLWPGKGDYDFNDVVLDYQFKQVLNSANKLVEFYLDYSVRAIGASLENGFAIEIQGTSADAIGTVTGSQLTGDYITLNANGTEAGQDHAVIVLFDNAFSMMESASPGFVNTQLETLWVEPHLDQLYVSFDTPVLFQNTGTAPFNPFLIVNKERGREVHLAGKTPTTLADESLLGTWFDDSDPISGKYYQSANNLPWGIDVPEKFEYAVEKNEIVAAHLQFGAWAESGGVLYPDWYKELSGYRNSSLIYTHD
ncbi:MAG: LruC domain-containing protein [Bacteroidales bacterium]